MLRSVIERIPEPLADRVLTYISHPRRIDNLRYLPSPSALRRETPTPAWDDDVPPTPEALRGVVGIRRRPELEDLAFAARPIASWGRKHAKAVVYMYRHGWEFLLPTAPRLRRAMVRSLASKRIEPRPAVARPSPETLAQMVRDEARRLGLSQVRFAPYDPRYTIEDFLGKHDDGSVIVCAYEQDFDRTQTAPSLDAERAAFDAYIQLTERMLKLGEYLRGLGIRAYVHHHGGELMTINYGVASGMGQLGLNGQLLTPTAGSRVRISVITTDAEIARDHPVDLGIEKICDACQACVRRCPPGAIRSKRKEHRGVTKVKIKGDRCFPVLAQTAGCAVCMKVCPVQRYGLTRIFEHFEETGDIIGVGTDDLEGFTWPIDGKYYDATSKPPIDSATLLHPPGLVFDASIDVAPQVLPEDDAPDLPAGSALT